MRKDIRLCGRDYERPGIYSVVLVTDQRQRIFAAIQGGALVLTEAGKILEEEIRSTATHRPNVSIMEYAILPDHVHLLYRFAGVVPGGLAGVVQGLKAAVTKRVNRSTGDSDISIWQANYWERVVRLGSEVWCWRAYIRANPRRWVERYGRAADDR